MRGRARGRAGGRASTRSVGSCSRPSWRRRRTGAPAVRALGARRHRDRARRALRRLDGVGRRPRRRRPLWRHRLGRGRVQRRVGVPTGDGHVVARRRDRCVATGTLSSRHGVRLRPQAGRDVRRPGRPGRRRRRLPRRPLGVRPGVTDVDGYPRDRVDPDPALGRRARVRPGAAAHGAVRRVLEQLPRHHVGMGRQRVDAGRSLRTTRPLARFTRWPGRARSGRSSCWAASWTTAARSTRSSMTRGRGTASTGPSWTRRSSTGAAATRWRTTRRASTSSFSATAARARETTTRSYEAPYDTWTRVRNDGPPPRTLAAMVVSDAGQAILFGGRNFADMRGDTWVLKGFPPEIGTHPLARESGPCLQNQFHVVARTDVQGAGPFTYRWRKYTETGFNQVEDGFRFSGAQTDTLVLDPFRPEDVGTYAALVSNECGTTESALAPLALADGHWTHKFALLLRRHFHQLAYDTARERMVTFGGRTIFDNFGLTIFGDTLERNGIAWQPVVPSGASPAPRYGYALAYDATRDVTVLHGGRTTNASFIDTEFGEHVGVGRHVVVAPHDTGPVPAPFAPDGVGRRARARRPVRRAEREPDVLRRSLGMGRHHVEPAQHLRRPDVRPPAGALRPRARVRRAPRRARAARRHLSLELSHGRRRRDVGARGRPVAAARDRAVRHAALQPRPSCDGVRRGPPGDTHRRECGGQRRPEPAPVGVVLRMDLGRVDAEARGALVADVRRDGVRPGPQGDGPRGGLQRLPAPRRSRLLARRHVGVGVLPVRSHLRRGGVRRRPRRPARGVRRQPVLHRLVHAPSGGRDLRRQELSVGVHRRRLVRVSPRHVRQRRRRARRGVRRGRLLHRAVHVRPRGRALRQSVQHGLVPLRRLRVRADVHRRAAAPGAARPRPPRPGRSLAPSRRPTSG